MTLTIICIYLALGLGSCSIVDTEYGQVSGHFVNVDNGRDPVMPIEVFRAVPYAKDTSGAGRFAGPEPREPWEGVFDATPVGPACPQGMPGALSFTHPGWDYFSEDCLYVDIFTKNVTGGPHAVMLWFFGGGFNAGSPFQYPGHFLATMDVVAVNVNYRLDQFGFAFSGNDVVPGNAGLWDQNFAMQWVIDNIGNFGGDPNRITIYGESAGAVAASLHQVSPHSKDLFQQAIMQSGWPAMVPLSIPNLSEMADNVGCLRGNDSETVECLRALPWETISENATCPGCLPLVDGEGGFLPKLPSTLRDEGSVNEGPIIAGRTHDEASVFLLGLVPGSLFGCCNRTWYEHILRERMVELVLRDADNVTIEDVYQSLDYNYSPWPHVYDNYANRDALETLLTDMLFGWGVDRLAEDHQEIANTWSYIYNFRGRNSSQLFPEWMGVPHIGELPYTWGITHLPFNQEVVDESLIQFDAIHWTDEDVQHGVFAMELWTNFAKYGNPTPEPVSNPLGGSTTWPTYTWDEMNVLEIKNTSVDVIKEYRKQDYAFWRRYIPYLLVDYVLNQTDTTEYDDQYEDILSWNIAFDNAISWLRAFTEEEDFNGIVNWGDWDIY